MVKAARQGQVSAGSHLNTNTTNGVQALPAQFHSMSTSCGVCHVEKYTIALIK